MRDRVRILKETEGGREEVCQLMEDRITEEKIEMAKDEIRLGELTLEQISRAFKLPLPVVQELARTQSVSA